MFIDSVIWIAYKNKNDSWHDKAKPLLPTILQRTRERAYVTDYVALETVNHLLRKTSFETAKETLEMFTKSPRITKVYNDEDSFRATYDVFLEYPGLSLTDANIVFHMARLRDSTLFSFDKGFDAVKGITRRETSPAQ